MTIAHAVQQKIAKLLRQETALCSALITALNEERHALEKRDFDAFNQSVQDKQQCATDLDAVEKVLFQLLATAGFSENRSGFHQFLEVLQSEEDPLAIHALWDELHMLMTDCRKQNQINGQIINVSMVATQQTLNILNGRDLHSTTYDQSGKPTDIDGNHKLAIA